MDVVTHHSIARFPFIKENRCGRPDGYGDMSQPIMRFKEMSRLRYFEWLRGFKPEQYQCALDKYFDERRGADYIV